MALEIHNDPDFRQELRGHVNIDIFNAASRLGELVDSSKAHLTNLIRADSSRPLVSLVLPTVEQFSKDASKSLPPLPPILSPELADVPFIHRAKATEVAQTTGKEADYERLEFLGDAYIEIIASRLIFSQYPTYAAGKLASLREKLVCNESLSKYALEYGFDERALIPKEYLDTGSDRRKLWVKLLGDVFEAYVAAVIVSDPSDGFSSVEKWLTALWKRELLHEHDTAPLDPSAKTTLATKILGTPPIKVEYKLEKEPQQRAGRVKYVIGVYLNGWGWKMQHLGTGTAESKNDAGTRAAMEALRNPLIAQIAAIKREHDGKVNAERAKEGGGNPAAIQALARQYKGI